MYSNMAPEQLDTSTGAEWEMLDRRIVRRSAKSGEYISAKSGEYILKSKLFPVASVRVTIVNQSKSQRMLISGAALTVAGTRVIPVSCSFSRTESVRSDEAWLVEPGNFVRCHWCFPIGDDVETGDALLESLHIEHQFSRV
jgi:hypothetical protein